MCRKSPSQTGTKTILSLFLLQMSETLWIFRLLSVAFVQMFLAKTSQATEDDYYNEDYSYYDRDDGELIEEHFSEWLNCVLCIVIYKQLSPTWGNSTLIRAGIAVQGL